MVNAFYGDSITAGSGLSNPTTECYPAILCGLTGWTKTNRGVPSSDILSNGQLNQIYNVANTYASGDTNCWLTGYNDMRYCGSNADALLETNYALKFLGAWMSVPTTSWKVYNDASIAYGGSWSPFSTEFGDMNFSTGSGNTATITATGSSILIGTTRWPAGGGFTITVDGTPVSGYDGARTTYALNPSGKTYGPGLIAIHGLSTGSHTVVLTTIDTGVIGVVWITSFSATPSIATYIGGCLTMPPSGYPLTPPYNNGSDGAAAAWGANIEDAVDYLATAGLNVKYVFTLLDVSTDYQVDEIHPNYPAGTTALANEFYDVINPAVAPTLDAISINSAGTTLSLTFSESVTGVIASEYHLTVATLSAASGSGSDWTMTISPKVYSGASPTLSYDGTSTINGDDIELEPFSGMAVTNNSTQEPPMSLVTSSNLSAFSGFLGFQ